MRATTVYRRPTLWAVSSLILLAIGILIGALALSPGPRVAATDAGTALDFNGSTQYVTFGAALGSRNGSAVATPTWVGGYPFPSPPPINNALQFNGSSQYVTFGAAPSLGASDFTLETWFNWTGGGTTAQTGTGGLTAAMPLITKGRNEADGTNADANYFLGIQGSKLAADFEEGAGQAVPGANHPLTGTTTITTNVWHHAAVTYNGSSLNPSLTLYLDGVLDGQINLTGAHAPRSDSIQHAALGSALNSTGAAIGFFAGMLDEARIWNVARSQSVIQAAMNGELV